MYASKNFALGTGVKVTDLVVAGINAVCPWWMEIL